MKILFIKIFGIGSLLCLSLVNLQAQSLEDARKYLILKQFVAAKTIVDNLENDTVFNQQSAFWLLRAKIYLQISEDIRGSVSNLDSMAVFKSFTAFIKTIELAEAKYLDSAQIGLQQLQKITLNNAGKYYKKGYEVIKKFKGQNIPPIALFDFKKANEYAELAQKINPLDTLGYSIAAYSAYYMQDFSKYNLTVEKWIPKIVNKSERYKLYENWLNINQDLRRDTVQTLKILAFALKDFPNDKKFKEARLNYSVASDNEEEIIAFAEEKVKQNPRSSTAYFDLALVYQRFNKLESAINSYKTCLKLDPSNFRAMFYLGGIFYNEGVNKLREIDRSSFTEYQLRGKEIEAQANEWFKKALPYFEEMSQMTPRSEDVLKPLYQIYKRLKMQSEAEKIKQRLQLINPAWGD